MEERSISSLPQDEFVKRFIPIGRKPDPRDYTGHYVLLASDSNSSTATAEWACADSARRLAAATYNVIGHRLRSRVFTRVSTSYAVGRLYREWWMRERWQGRSVALMAL